MEEARRVMGWLTRFTRDETIADLAGIGKGREGLQSAVRVHGFCQCTIGEVGAKYESSNARSLGSVRVGDDMRARRTPKSDYK